MEKAWNELIMEFCKLLRIDKFCNWLNKKFTRNYKEVPLFWVMFDLNKYLKDGSTNSCISKLHPTIGNDIFIKDKLFEIIDYIRSTYDMEKLSK